MSPSLTAILKLRALSPVPWLSILTSHRFPSKDGVEPFDDGVVEVVAAARAVREPESVVSEQVVSEQVEDGEVELVGVEVAATAPEAELVEELAAEAGLEPVVAQAELEPVVVADVVLIEGEPAPDAEAEPVSDPEA
jgi:hypothetical protein